MTDQANALATQIEPGADSVEAQVPLRNAGNRITGMALDHANGVAWIAGNSASTVYLWQPPYVFKEHLPLLFQNDKLVMQPVRPAWLSYGQWAIPTLLFVGLALLYLLAIPLGESPDEPGHLQCVQQVAVGNHLPRVEPKPQGDWWKPGVTLSGRMCYHMPLYYLAGGTLQKAIGWLTGEPVQVTFPAYNDAFTTTGVMFLHPEKTRLYQWTEPATVGGLRLFAIGLSIVVVLTSVALARALYPSAPYAGLVAGLVVAGWPQFLFLSRAISNDVMANALAAGALMILLRFGRPGRYPWALGLALLATLTKINLLFVVGVVCGMWVSEWLRTPALRRALVRSLFVMAACAALAVAFIWLTPTVRDNLLQSERAFGRTNAAVSTIAYWQEVISLTFSSGWVRFGWMNVTTPDWMTYVWWGITGGLALGGALRWRREPVGDKFLMGSLLFFWVAGVLVSYIRINLSVMQPQFRFLQALLPLLASFVAGGLLSGSAALANLLHRRMHPLLGIVVLTAVLVALNLGVLQLAVAPHYGLRPW